MPSNPKKRVQNKQVSSPTGFWFPIIRYLASFPPYYLTIRLIGAVFLLLIVIGSGDLLTITGLVLGIGIIGYVLLIYLGKWVERHDN